VSVNKRAKPLLSCEKKPLLSDIHRINDIARRAIGRAIAVELAVIVSKVQRQQSFLTQINADVCRKLTGEE